MAVKFASASRIDDTSGVTDGVSTLSNHSARSATSIAHSSAIFLPLILDSSAWGARRMPPQAGHSTWVTARSTDSRAAFCNPSFSLLRRDDSSRGISPR